MRLAHIIRSPRSTLLAVLAAVPLATGCGPADGAEGLASSESGAKSGMPSGAHYGLNIIGVSNDKNPNFSGGEGHRIFVALEGNTRINLSEGDYGVIDANGTDGVAAYSMPSPDPDGDGITTYTVWVRALGKPGGSMTMTTCATYDGQDYCNWDQQVSVKRSKGKSTWTNVSRELLYVYADLDGDGTAERYPLFSEEMEGYYWSYDNNGLRLAQLRFYEGAYDTNQ